MAVTEDPASVEIRHIAAAELDLVLAAGHLFDLPPTPQTAADFLRRSGHHLLIAFRGSEAVGFVTGVEIAHPDKAVEMLLYELGVAEKHRRRGIGRRLVTALRGHAESLGCRGMWVPVDTGDLPAISTYLSAGATGPEGAQILAWAFPHRR